MPHITLNRTNLKYNFDSLNRLFAGRAIQWSVVSKMLCGNTLFLQELVDLGIRQICDARIINIKAIKAIAPDIETVYIKPPASSTIRDVIRYADISCNTQYETLLKLSEEAVRRDKTHKVIIMVELGELREGVMREHLMNMYERASLLPRIEVVGIGANFTCLSGVLPDRDKLNQLALYKELIEAKYDTALPYVSGGSSVTIPLLLADMVPSGVNHFKVGESLFFGTDVYHGGLLPDMKHDILKLHAEIIEVEEKPVIPEGIFSSNLEGHTPEFNPEDKGKTSCRAILDFGLLDVDYLHTFPEDQTVSCIGAASDMLVVDLGNNPNNYKVGDYIVFDLDYMSTCRLMNSPYILKRVVNTCENSEFNKNLLKNNKKYSFFKKMVLYLHHRTKTKPL